MKPIEDWTLSEVQEYCKNREDCKDCIFYNENVWDCRVYTIPNEWKLSKIKPENSEEACESTKPHLAEILGVEVGERFHIAGSEGKTFWVTDKGYFETDPPHFSGSSFLLMDAINHPEKIARNTRLTEAELAICKAVGAKWVSRNQIGMDALHLWDKKPSGDRNFYNGDARSLATVAESFFPSLKPGDCICVEEDE